MDILLHACCGPCSCYSTAKLLEDGWQPALFFYNPNIHPYQEYLSRLDGLLELGQIRNLPVYMEPDYELEEFLAAVAANPGERCGHCYRMRLAKTAAKAVELGVKVFGSTLLISPYQNRDLLLEVGREIAGQHGLTFHEEDFRPGFRQSQAQAKEYGLYRQKYCGCIYSEKERFYKKDSLLKFKQSERT
jgi:predicted adenine nucleotide alpha hydrolase (AANH) superfamily ATPase